MVVAGILEILHRAARRFDLVLQRARERDGHIRIRRAVVQLHRAGECIQIRVGRNRVPVEGVLGRRAHLRHQVSAPAACTLRDGRGDHVGVASPILQHVGVAAHHPRPDDARLDVIVDDHRAQRDEATQ